MAKIRAAIFNRQQYADDFKRKHHSLEQTQYRNFKKALDSQTEQVIHFIHLHGVENLEHVISILIDEQAIKNAYKRCYLFVGVEQAKWTYRRIQRIAIAQKSWITFFSERWRRLMSTFFETQSSDKITNVNETTKDTIRQLLSESQDLPTSQRADYIVNQLKSPDFNRMRALRIARTETTTAANYGAVIGGESSDYEVGKTWVPILDMNTRPAHAEMDGTPAISMNEAFVVGGEELMYPGDPNGSASNVINCRCALAVIPLLDDRGIPILKKAA